MAEKKNIPEIRFKGFKDEWEECKLGDVGSVMMNKRIFKKISQVIFYRKSNCITNADVVKSVSENLIL